MNWPSLAEQRLGALEERAAGWRRNGWISDEQRKAIARAAATAWRRHSFPLAITFFVLTCVAVEAVAGFLHLLHLPYGPITAAGAIAVAELLIRSRRFVRTGVESALWISGLVAFIVWLPSQNKPEAILVFAAAFLLSGLRVRNALLITAAAVLVTVYVAVKAHSYWPSLVVGLLFALAAAAALIAREWRHPWIERTFAVLAVVMPFAACVSAGLTPHFRLQAGAVLAGAGVLLLIAGALRRHVAVLVSGALSIALAAWEIQQRIEWREETKLIVAGAFVLAIAIVLTRKLRGNTRGFVVDRIAERYEAMQVIGAIHVDATTAAATPAQQEFKPGDGSFGGGGATGDV